MSLTVARKPRMKYGRPIREWTPAEVASLRAEIVHGDFARIAVILGRSKCSINCKALKLGLVTRRHWTSEEKQFVRDNFRKMPAEKIAAAIDRTTSGVFQCARMIGLSIPQRFKAPDFVAFLKEKNALGWSDARIAFARRVDRPAVAHLRRKLGLPVQTFSAFQRNCTREKTLEQIKAAGVKSLADVRCLAFRDFARRRGWPEDLRPRAVQILNTLWARGPMTRRELADAIGMPWKGSRKSLVSNDPGGTYLTHLMRRGLVVCLPRAHRVTGKGKGHSCHIYSLPLTIERSTFERSNDDRRIKCNRSAA